MALGDGVVVVIDLLQGAPPVSFSIILQFSPFSPFNYGQLKPK